MTMEEAAAAGLQASEKKSWHHAARILGLGRVFILTVAGRRCGRARKRTKVMRLFTGTEVEIIQKYLWAQARLPRKKKKQVAPAPEPLNKRALMRATEWAAQLIAEGEDPSIAQARARAAYGLQEDAPEGNPQPSDAKRREWLIAAAEARRTVIQTGDAR